MKIAVYVAGLLLLLSSTGCLFGRHKKSAAPPPANVNLAPGSTNAAENFTITPDQGVVGRVSSVNGDLHFVVLTFPFGHLPPVGSRMNIFRNGAIVGEVKISGPQRDDNSVADIILGDAQKGDEVRPR